MKKISFRYYEGHPGFPGMVTLNLHSQFKRCSDARDASIHAPEVKKHAKYFTYNCLQSSPPFLGTLPLQTSKLNEFDDAETYHTITPIEKLLCLAPFCFL